MLTGHDPTGEGGLQQGNLKEAGSVWLDSNVNTSLVSVLGLTQLDLFSFAFPASGHEESQLCFPEGRAANQCFLWLSELK